MKNINYRNVINIFLFSLSILLFFISISFFLVSVFTLVNFFFANIQVFNKIQEGLENNEITLYNPGLFDISKFSLDAKINVFNKSFNFLRFDTRIKAKNTQKVFLEKINLSLIEDEIKNKFFEFFSVYNDSEKVKFIIQKEIENSKLVGNFSIEIEEILKTNIKIELNFSGLIWK